MPKPSVTSGATALATATLWLGLAACGSSHPVSGSASSQLKLAQCMRAHGVNVPDPNFSARIGAAKVVLGRASIPPAVKRANEACRHVARP